MINTEPAQANSAVLDTTAADPQWQQTAPMNDARIYHTLTMLANGQVLAVGGGTTSDQSADHNRRPADRDLGPDQRAVVSWPRRSPQRATTTQPRC